MEHDLHEAAERAGVRHYGAGWLTLEQVLAGPRTPSVFSVPVPIPEVDVEPPALPWLPRRAVKDDAI